ncbi:hypothetical protein RRG08_058709 [Elysia crispata]|uniref:Uncharacterized protein n=1 Tax=Elysia crispata TaxID=231223 RepID=A0AAE0YWF5_9GAST|nr:hypothetical protein RRG08_058709 [Elysia crispata]
MRELESAPKNTVQLVLAVTSSGSCGKTAVSIRGQYPGTDATLPSADSKTKTWCESSIRFLVSTTSLQKPLNLHSREVFIVSWGAVPGPQLGHALTTVRNVRTSWTVYCPVVITEPHAEWGRHKDANVNRRPRDSSIAESAPTALPPYRPVMQ